jgi:hypothetical protein
VLTNEGKIIKPGGAATDNDDNDEWWNVQTRNSYGVTKLLPDDKA